MNSSHSKKLRRILLLLPLLIFIGVNLAGTFYVTNLHDFQAFLDAGQALVDGGNPYGNADLGISTNLNPPISLFVFRYLAGVDAQQAYLAWKILSLVLYILAVALLIRAYRPLATPLRVAWAFAFMALWYTLLLGQLYALLLLASVIAWLLLKDASRERAWPRQILAGLLLGLLVAIKPNFLFWPFLLLLTGWYAAAFTAFGLAGVITVIPAVVFGPGIYLDWLAALARLPGDGAPGQSVLVRGGCPPGRALAGDGAGGRTAGRDFAAGLEAAPAGGDRERPGDPGDAAGLAVCLGGICPVDSADLHEPAGHLAAGGCRGAAYGAGIYRGRLGQDLPAGACQWRHDLPGGVAAAGVGAGEA